MNDVWEQIKEFIDKRVPDEQFVVSEWADTVQAEAVDQIPDVFALFQSQLANRQIAMYLADHLRKHRNATNNAIRRLDTEEKISAAVESGKIAFYIESVCVGPKTWKAIGDTTKQDAVYLAETYKTSGARHLLESKFWDQIRRCIPSGKTLSDVMPEIDCVRLYQSITSQTKPVSATEAA